MADLSTNYMGISLTNPIIAGASSLCLKADNLKKLEEAGASAIVFKSLFEEQIQLENYEMNRIIEGFNERNAEMLSIFPHMPDSGPQQHLIALEKAVKSVSIPIFASLNAVNPETWIEWSYQLAQIGVAGLELNFYYLPKFDHVTEVEFLEQMVQTITKIKSRVNIPIAIKLSPYYFNLLGILKSLEEAGADGFVLFNRFFQPDIDIQDEKHTTPFNLSHSGDYRLALRYTGLIYGRTKAGICASQGIYKGEEIIKLILAGADCVQVVSALYKKGIDHISTMISEIEQWMESKNYSTISEFKGKLSEKNTKNPFIYRRAQYIDFLMKAHSLTWEEYPTI